MAYGTAALWNSKLLSPRLLRPISVGATLFVVAFSVWRWEIRNHSTPQKEWDRIAFASRVESLTEPSAAIIMVRSYRGMPALYQHRTSQGEYLECDPVDFYHSHRTGWSLDDRQAALAFIETLRGRGARYFATAFPEIFEKHPGLKARLDAQYTPVDVTPRWAIYRLDKSGHTPEEGLTSADALR
jgi:hypothetical protein